jgi:serine/threonine-protein kinase
VGVVHRDLKPGNIMVSARPDGGDAVKVVDFDIAKGPNEPEGEEVTRVGFVVGTPEYMSPEQLMGDRLDGRSDVYSLGVVLFRMLAGALPFRAPSTQEMMVQRLTGEPLRLGDVATDLAGAAAVQRALDRALARRAQDRQASASELGRELRAALGPAALGPAPPVTHPAAAELAPTVLSPAPGGTPPPKPPRRPTPLLLGLGAGLVVAAVAVGAMLRDSPSPPATDPRPAADTTSDSLSTVVVGPDVGADTLTAETDPEPPPGGGGTVADERGGEAPNDRRSTVTSGNVRALLDRQLALIRAGAEGTRLAAVRDSGQLGWRLARTRGDSAAAALVLTQAALRAGEDGECARWARLGAALDASLFEMLVQVCQ